MKGESSAVEEGVHFESEYLLEGILHRPSKEAARGGVVICHPHPLYGGNMNYHLVSGVARVCAAQGMAALRFNFRGVGGSGGKYAGGIGEVNDVAAALKYLGRQIAPQAPLGLVGYSFGSLVAARYVAAGGKAEALVLIAFALNFKGVNVDDYAGLAQYAGPLLVIAGGRDELGPPEAVEAALNRLGARGEVLVFPEVDHFFGGAAKSAGEAAASFLIQSFEAVVT